MAAKNEFAFTVEVSPYHLGVMLTNSVQFAIPRNTGMPNLIRAMFEAYLPHIPLDALRMAAGDIERASRWGDLASDSEYEWPRLLEIIKGEIDRRRDHGL